MRLFGLIGKNIGHSFSPEFFTTFFKQNNIVDARYELFDLASLDELPTVTSRAPLSGLNVTIPYKEEIIPYLDEVDEIAKSVNAVNTINFRRGCSVGCNTDIYGFKNSFTPLLEKHHKLAYILGSGGASKAVKFVLNKLSIECKVVSRKPTGSEIRYADLKEKIKDTIIINTTPVGMFPDINDCPQIPYNELNHRNYLYDLVYNPAETQFLRKGRIAGAITKGGREMLELQALESWRIWNSEL